MDSLSSDGRAVLGARIRHARTASGLTLRELSRRLDVSPATVSALENGKSSVRVDRLGRIADLLGVTTGDLLVPETPAPATGGATSARIGEGWRHFGAHQLDAVLTALLGCVVEKGYSATSMRDVAERSGSSVAALYYYYATKQDMLVALLDATMTDLLARTYAARGDGHTCVQRFELLVESLILYHTHRRELAFVGSSEMRSLAGENRNRIAQKRIELQRMVDTEVDAGVEAGFFRTRHPHEASRAVVTMCVSVAQWYRPTGHDDPAVIARTYQEFALDLVRYRPKS